MNDTGDTFVLIMQCFLQFKLGILIGHPGAAVSHRLTGTPIEICGRAVWTIADSPGGAPRCPVAAQLDLAFPSKPLG